MKWQKHLSDHDLERYTLGMVKDDSELAPVQEHILACGWCAERADEVQNYMDAMRVGAILLEEEERETFVRPISAAETRNLSPIDGVRVSQHN